ncbi:exostosin domain-containing protein [Nonlabens agnitus]|uniref:Exostosin GT47 domain-containing protein n=1 Tax=Nonlabens agnitus TaxID=870484 RepID=A0A2S9WU29_9FLAO|nr:exostosin family protein [Nonlabens agnitus]PRP66980.1 hypothetical protein BST86_07650 [Nonlabens agnitus]
MIKLYTIQEMLVPEHRGCAHPLIFDLHYFENTDPITHEHYSLIENPEDADAFIFPIDILSREFRLHKKEYADFLKMAKSHSKKVFVYTGGDYGTTIEDPAVITWRLAGSASTNSAQTIIMPSMINDPVQHKIAELLYLPLKSKPQIAFTGFADKSPIETVRYLLANKIANLKRLLAIDRSDCQDFFNAPAKRYDYLKSLEMSKVIDTDFIYRKKYRAGATNQETRKKTTLEFFQNLTTSPYTFCMRGAGNFSVRFYESLACGRIPVVIDTDIVLPLENIIDWNKHICLIKPDQQIDEKLYDFHQQFTEQTFLECQAGNRKLYETQLVRHHYFCSIHDHLKAML